MPDTYLYPDGDDIVTLFENQASSGVNLYLSIDDLQGAPDDSSTYVTCIGVNPSTYRATVDNTTAGVILAVNMYTRQRVTNLAINGTSQIRLNIGGGNYWAISTNTTSYVTYSHGWDTVDPSTSGNWTPAVVNSCKLTFTQSGDAIHQYRITSAYLGVRSAGGGGLLAFGWEILMPLISTGLFSHGLMCEKLDTIRTGIREILGHPKNLPVPWFEDEIKSITDGLFVRPVYNI
jgi:hypothetical protein